MKSQNKKISSLSFAFMLIISTFAFAFIIGSEVGGVNAADPIPLNWQNVVSGGNGVFYKTDGSTTTSSASDMKYGVSAAIIGGKQVFVVTEYTSGQSSGVRIYPTDKLTLNNNNNLQFGTADTDYIQYNAQSGIPTNSLGITPGKIQGNLDGYFTSSSSIKGAPNIAVGDRLTRDAVASVGNSFIMDDSGSFLGTVGSGATVTGNLGVGIAQYEGEEYYFITDYKTASGGSVYMVPTTANIDSTFLDNLDANAVKIGVTTDEKMTIPTENKYKIPGAEIPSDAFNSAAGSNLAKGVSSLPSAAAARRASLPAGLPTTAELDKASGLFVDKATGIRYNKDGSFADRGTMQIGKYQVPFGLGQIFEGATWSLAVAGAIKTLGPILGLEEEETNAYAVAAMAGIMAGKLAYSFLGRTGTFGSKWMASESGWLGKKSLFGFGGKGQTARFISSPATSFVIGAAVAWLTYNAMWEDEKKTTETVTFSCLPWQAPHGGSACELCNDKTGLPCSEYRCKSLGQSCELINQGTSAEMCINANIRDVSPPIIKPNPEVLTEGYQYFDVKDMPPGAGFKIRSTSTSTGCIKPFTPITFGITTDEPAQCKIDVEQGKTYEQMATYMGGDSIYKYNHTEYLSLPSVNDIKNSSLNLQNGRELSFFIKCRDAAGNVLDPKGESNQNEADYELKVCVDPTPDTTAPQIQGTSITDGSCISATSDNASVTFYVNEPAECRWGFTPNQNFEQMQYNMTCSNLVQDINALMVYPCTTQLTGVARDGTSFYVRCKDQPSLGANDSKRNPNREDYVFKLRGSNPLKLKTVKPDETVYGAVRPAPVELYAETLFGCDSNGKAVCMYSTTGQEGSFIPFFDTNKIDGIHTQRLDLDSGQHTYYIRCVDAGGNMVEQVTQFNMEIDTNAPLVVRAYQEDGYLKIITPRASECEYSNDNCDFVMGTSEATIMPYANAPEHITQWFSDKTYYIKCRDEFRSEPTDCSIIIRPTDNFL